MKKEVNWWLAKDLPKDFVPTCNCCNAWMSYCLNIFCFHSVLHISSISMSSSSVIFEKSCFFLIVLPIWVIFRKVGFSTLSRRHRTHFSLRRKVLPLRWKVSRPNKNLKLCSSLMKAAEGVISPSELSELSSAFFSSQYSSLSLPELDFGALNTSSFGFS